MNTKNSKEQQSKAQAKIASGAFKQEKVIVVNSGQTQHVKVKTRWSL